MAFIPVNLNTDGRLILVVGGGKVALHKLKTIIKFARNVTVIAPKILPEIERLGVRVTRRQYCKTLLNGAFLVYACTDDTAVNRQVRRDARGIGILANVADDKKLCDFISPAVYKRGHMAVSVCSQGKDVKSAVVLRDRIKRYLEDDKRLRRRSS
jgi:precorrin-2 dehydrogenase/sirohydrochlorin ferrochelatase